MVRAGVPDRQFLASVDEVLEEDFEGDALVGDLAVRHVALYLDAAVVHELDLPVDTRRHDLDADGIRPERTESIRNLCCSEPLDEVKKSSELIGRHGSRVPPTHTSERADRQIWAGVALRASTVDTACRIAPNSLRDRVRLGFGHEKLVGSKIPHRTQRTERQRAQYFPVENHSNSSGRARLRDEPDQRGLRDMHDDEPPVLVYLTHEALGLHIQNVAVRNQRRPECEARASVGIPGRLRAYERAPLTRGGISVLHDGHQEPALPSHHNNTFAATARTLKERSSNA
jgi:hypothetical protein